MNGYWFFEERDDGVYITCESITLTRDIPFGMATLIGPVIHDLPGEALRKSLEQTRRAVAGVFWLLERLARTSSGIADPVRA
jgi:hypothetical protein